MTETRFTWRWLLVIALVGIFMGLAVGLAAGWVIFPNIGGSNVSGLSLQAQSDYIVLVANTYAYDQDGAAAKRRLALLGDKDIKTRVERLAKSLAARQDPSAANVADLALELGSEDTSVQVMAEQAFFPADTSSEAEPTKLARIANASDDSSTEPDAATTEESNSDADPTSTPGPKVKPTKVKKPKATNTPEVVSEEPTEAAPTDIPATREPQPTAVPTVAPAVAAPVTTEFTPSFPSMWWDAVRFAPAQVAAGQQYWHLKYARYCDWAPNDNYETCPGFPGGGMGTSIYVMTVDESGNCITTDVNDDLNDGSKYPLTTDALKQIQFSWNPYGYGCDQNYEKGMYGEGNSISVPGMPSDRIEGLCLCNKTPVNGQSIMQGHAHVRYFLIFQRTTR